MCGIFFYFGKKYHFENLLIDFNKIINRGPDQSKLIDLDDKVFGFHRLAINDLSEDGMQPFIDNNIYLICNGEIYNHNFLKNEFNIDCKSNSDCEVIIHLYKLVGIEKTCQLLDGVFAFVLYDGNLDKLYVARDPYGVRPLFMGNNEEKELFISSELKTISDKCKVVDQFNQGTYLEYKKGDIFMLKKYHDNNFKIDSLRSDEFILTCIKIC